MPATTPPPSSRDINGASRTTGVSASLDSGNHLVLQSSDAATAVTIGGGSSASVLSELGLSAGTTNPTNLITQGAVTTPQTLTITVGANPALTVTFGTGAGQVSTLQGLETALSGLAGGIASVDPATGNLSITALNSTDSITVGRHRKRSPISASRRAPRRPAPAPSVSLSEDVAGSPSA